MVARNRLSYCAEHDARCSEGRPALVREQMTQPTLRCVLGPDYPTENEMRQGRFSATRDCAYCQQSTPNFCKAKECWKPICMPRPFERNSLTDVCAGDINGFLICRDCRDDFPKCSTCNKNVRLVMCRTPGCLRYARRYGYGCRAGYGFDMSERGVGMCDPCSIKYAREECPQA